MLRISGDSDVILLDRLIVILCHQRSVSVLEGIANDLVGIFDLLVLLHYHGVLFGSLCRLGLVGRTVSAAGVSRPIAALARRDRFSLGQLLAIAGRQNDLDRL